LPYGISEYVSELEPSDVSDLRLQLDVLARQGPLMMIMRLTSLLVRLFDFLAQAAIDVS